MEIVEMQGRPRSRIEFERNMFFMIEKLKNGQVRFAHGILSKDSLLRIRYLPNRRLDMLSIDESARLLAHTLMNAELNWKKESEALAGAPEEQSNLTPYTTNNIDSTLQETSNSTDDEELAKVFLEKIFQVVDLKNTDMVLDQIYDQIDDWLLDGRFSLCDEVMRLLCQNYLDACLQNIALGVGFLTITSSARSQMPSRSTFGSHFKDELYKQGTNTQELDLLLSGLL